MAPFVGRTAGTVQLVRGSKHSFSRFFQRKTDAIEPAMVSFIKKLLRPVIGFALLTYMFEPDKFRVTEK